MAPFSAFASTGWSNAPTSLSRFNGIASYEFSGQPGQGQSSGQALAKMEALAAQIPGRFRIACRVRRFRSGWHRARRRSSTVCRCSSCSCAWPRFTRAGRSRSRCCWSFRLGLVGAVFAVTLRGLQNDVYLQIGLLTTMGLAAKNAILMIEFAEQAEKQGKRVIEAALEAARIRLRPILMTSFAFIFGVLPLAISTGAGANSRIAIGTAVIGGMLTATLLAVFYIPLVLRAGATRRARRAEEAAARTPCPRRRRRARHDPQPHDDRSRWRA